MIALQYERSSSLGHRKRLPYCRMPTFQLTEHCPHCDKVTSQTYVKEVDAGGKIVVNVTTCDECGQVVED